LQEVGYLFLFATDERKGMIAAAVALQNEAGLHTRLIRPDEIRELVPGIWVTDLLGGAYGPEDGYLDPRAVMRGLHQGAQRVGVKVFEGVAVTSLEHTDNRVRGVGTNGSVKFAPDVVINAAGAWAPSIARMYGGDLPIEPRRSQLFVMEHVPGLSAPIPFTFDWTSRVHMRTDGTGIRAGSAVKPAVPDPDLPVECDWSETGELHAKLARRLPSLSARKFSRGWAGLIEVTEDDNPIVGWTHLDNLYTAAGFSGHGMCIGMGLAEQAAAEIAGSRPTIPLDLFRLDRFASATREPERMWGGSGISAEEATAR
jgi:sarcosine oxidase subunit beta